MIILKITCYISPCANILRISLMYLTSSVRYILLKNYGILLQGCPKWLLCLLCAILDRCLYMLIKLAASCVPDHHSELGRWQVTFPSSALCHLWFFPTWLVQPLKSYNSMKCIHYFWVQLFGFPDIKVRGRNLLFGLTLWIFASYRSHASLWYPTRMQSVPDQVSPPKSPWRAKDSWATVLLTAWTRQWTRYGVFWVYWFVTFHNPKKLKYMNSTNMTGTI